MNKYFNASILIIFLFSMAACKADADKEKRMFVEKVQNLIEAKDEASEKVALGELLVTAKQTGTNYGYRVFDITKNQQINPQQINKILEDKLQVTIFVGEAPPYKEFVWHPKYNGHVTRLIVP